MKSQTSACSVLGLATAALVGILMNSSNAGQPDGQHYDAAKAAVIDQGAPVRSMAFSPCGKLLATAGKNGVRLWEVSTGKESIRLVGAAIPRPKVGWLRTDHGFDVLTFSDDGAMLAAAEAVLPPPAEKRGVLGRIRVWSISDGKLLARRKFDDRLWSLAFSPDGKLLAFGHMRNGFGVWNVPDDRLWKAPLKKPVSQTACMRFSPDGKLLAVADDPMEASGHLVGGGERWVSGGDGTIRLLDAATKNTGHRLSADGSQGIHAFIFSEDGKQIIAAYEDGRVRIWEVQSGKLLRAFRIYNRVLWRAPIAFSPQAKLLAAGDWYNDTVALWDLAGERRLFTVNIGRQWENYLAMAPDAKLLATMFTSIADENGKVSLWTLGRKVDELRDDLRKQGKTEGKQKPTEDVTADTCVVKLGLASEATAVITCTEENCPGRSGSSRGRCVQCNSEDREQEGNKLNSRGSMHAKHSISLQRSAVAPRQPCGAAPACRLLRVGGADVDHWRPGDLGRNR